MGSNVARVELLEKLLIPSYRKVSLREGSLANALICLEIRYIDIRSSIDKYYPVIFINFPTSAALKCAVENQELTPIRAADRDRQSQMS